MTSSTIKEVPMYKIIRIQIDIPELLQQYIDEGEYSVDDMDAQEQFEILKEQADICDVLEGVIQQNSSEIEPHLVVGLESLDDRARYLDDTFKITEITHLGGNKFRLFYEFMWEAYYGCRDMNRTEDAEDHVDFEVIGDEIVFSCFVPPERRSTDDEF
jgi:hypothetical protein